MFVYICTISIQIKSSAGTDHVYFVHSSLAVISPPPLLEYSELVMRPEQNVLDL